MPDTSCQNTVVCFLFRRARLTCERNKQDKNHCTIKAKPHEASNFLA